MKTESTDIVFEDNHLLIVNKNAGMLVQGDRTRDRTLLDAGKKYIKKKYNKPGNVYLGLVHRIDRPVSGLVILTKTSKALERMNAQFRNKEVKKIYWAITENVPESLEGSLQHWLTKDRTRNFVRASINKKPGSVKAELNYRTISHINQYYLLEIQLLTGRFHQIRTQLSNIHCPIVGDTKYGYTKSLPDGSICLHSRQIEFTHPVKNEKMIMTAPLPESPQWLLFKNLT